MIPSRTVPTMTLAEAAATSGDVNYPARQVAAAEAAGEIAEALRQFAGIPRGAIGLYVNAGASPLTVEVIAIAELSDRLARKHGSEELIRYPLRSEMEADGDDRAPFTIVAVALGSSFDIFHITGDRVLEGLESNEQSSWEPAPAVAA